MMIEKGIFSGICLVLELDSVKVRFKEKIRLKSHVLNNGGIISYIVTKKCNFVVVNDKERADNSYKCRQAAKLAVPVVTMDYIYACIEEGQLINYTPFLVLHQKEMGIAKKESWIGNDMTIKTSQADDGDHSLPRYSLKAYTTEDDPCIKGDCDYEVLTFVVFKSKADVKMHKVIELHKLSRIRTEVESYRLYVQTKIIISKVDTASERPEETQVCYCSSVKAAMETYQDLCSKEYQKGSSKLIWKQLGCIGSTKLRKTIQEWQCEEIGAEVGDLVNALWREALDQLQKDVATRLSNIKLEKIKKAEGILLLLKSLVVAKDGEKKHEEISSLSDEFYDCVPCVRRAPLDHLKTISHHLDLCQLLCDMVTVSESTNYSDERNTRAKYRALRCSIRHISKNCNEWNTVLDLVTSSATKDVPFVIHDVFALSRHNERDTFNPRKFSNVQRLFHASKPQNFVGILSRLSI